jgi:amino-acid N-acetyltransferase
MALINPFAASNLMLPRGPQYLYENIHDFVVAVENDLSTDIDQQHTTVPNRILGCCSLHVLWRDIAEIRALAIDPDFQHKGIGMALVEYLKQESYELKIKSLYTFTMTTDFFNSMGFKLMDKEDLPPKLWGECSRCPKYFQCDEVGMVYHL